MAKQFWLMKSEPDGFSIFDLKKKGRTSWDGVRNYTARNFMRDKMKKGDLAFFYHSSCEEPGVAGIMEVCQESHPDPSQFDASSKYYDPKALASNPRWFLVDLKFKKAAKKVVPLSMMREMQALQGMALFRYNRLSITPVSPAEWKFIVALKGFW
jgi:predicted RNA-binding protein with PUA-like domain